MAAAALLVAVGSAQAQTVQFGAVLNGQQEVPPVTTPGNGVGTLTWNDAASTVGVTLSFSNLIAPTIPVGPGGAPAHVHLGFPGENGGIVIPLVGVSTGVREFLGYSRTFSFTELGDIGVSAANLTALRTRLNSAPNASGFVGLYFNVHTDPQLGGVSAGEIRGNIAVVPEPSTYALMATGLLGLGLAARRRRA